MGNLSVLRVCAAVLALAFSACGVSSGLSDEPQGNLPGALSDNMDPGSDPAGDGDGDAGDGDGDGDAGDGDSATGSGMPDEPPPPCGDGTETCNPDDLGGETCQSLGAFGGTLACDPVTCTYDMSMCIGGGANAGGGGTGGFFGGQQQGGGQQGGGMFGGGN
jgi:hypothetical protein